MKSKKFLFTVLIVFVALFIFGVINVNATTEYEESLIYKIAPDGKNATLKMEKPTDGGEFYIILENVLNELLNDQKYKVSAHSTNGELTNCNIEIINRNTSEVIETYNINVTYDEPEENEFINSIIKNMKTPKDVIDFENYYHVSDLNLINLYMVGDLWSQNEAKMLKFSKDFIDLSEGSDVSFYLITRAGGSGHMFNFAVGDMSLFYDGYCYGNIGTGIYLQNVIYIPKNTKETSEEYVKAAQKRIDNYLGKNNKIKVTYGGTLNSLEDYINEEDILQKEKNDGNYYNITIEGKTYKFYIMKGSDEQLKKPKYRGKHIKSDIKITTDNSEVPLDTHLTVETVKSEEIKKAIGTDNYEAYDIKLYSNTKDVSITKLDNGKFLVEIPVSSSLNGKNIVTYYLNSNNELEEYETVVKDGVASFETDHFSTYILAEKEEKVQTYKLIFDTNEGKFTNGKTKIEFEDVTKFKTTDIENPVKDGYTFKGWFTEKTGGISFDTVMNGEVGIQKDSTFYAQWEENSSVGEREPEISEGREQENNNNKVNTNQENTNTGNTNTGADNNAETGKNPQTSDNIMVYVIMLSISVMGIIVITNIRKNRQND